MENPELKKLKEMLVEAHTYMRSRKQKNTPTFGVEMYLLECIIQCNSALNFNKKETQWKHQQ